MTERVETEISRIDIPKTLEFLNEGNQSEINNFFEKRVERIFTNLKRASESAEKPAELIIRFSDRDKDQLWVRNDQGDWEFKGSAPLK